MIMDSGSENKNREGRWEIRQLRIELGNDEEARVNLTRNAPDEKRREPMTGKKQLRDPKENLKGEEE